MVIDFTEAVSATKYLSDNSDNANKVSIWSLKAADTEQRKPQFKGLHARLCVEAGWQK